MSVDRDRLAENAHAHAWDWFALHAAQRMQSFNYFLVATGLLAAGYASLLDKEPVAAVAVALIGVWIGYWFTRLDIRVRQLVHAGEVALRITEAQIAEQLGIPELNIVDLVKIPAPGATLYSQVIAMVEWSAVAAFATGALYAGWLSTTSHHGQEPWISLQHVSLYGHSRNGS